MRPRDVPGPGGATEADLPVARSGAVLPASAALVAAGSALDLEEAFAALEAALNDSDGFPPGASMAMDPRDRVVYVAVEGVTSSELAGLLQGSSHVACLRRRPI